MISLDTIAILIVIAASISAITVGWIAYRDQYILASHVGIFIIGMIFGVSASAFFILRMLTFKD